MCLRKGCCIISSMCIYKYYIKVQQDVFVEDITMKLKKLFAVAAVFCTLAILLAGCGAKADKASIGTPDDIAGLNIAV